ncbi:hypothetical protein P3342_007516 [Pyrenophora teres f. teres]|nr:hypothetical protein P3342_007516 [Pyrenophora teres f. teres]
MLSDGTDFGVKRSTTVEVRKAQFTFIRHMAEARSVLRSSSDRTQIQPHGKGSSKAQLTSQRKHKKRIAVCGCSPAFRGTGHEQSQPKKLLDARSCILLVRPCFQM